MSQKENEVDEVKKEIAVLTERVSCWMESTTEYRKSLCTKIDAILKSMSDLPCRERKVFYDGIRKELATIWSILVLIVGAIIVEYLKK